MLRAQEEEEVPVFPVVGELIIGTLAFAVLCFILLKFVFPKMEQMYQQRVAAIEGGLAKAEAAQNEANALLEQYRMQLAEARTEASQIRDEAREEGNRILEEMRTSAREESERIVARGAEQLAVERQQLVTELRGDVGRLAVELASKVVGESLADEARRAGTVDRFLAELDGLDTAGASR
ncbi:MAG: F0F1 ATP synthase subunit B [Corynebacteriales bacterium]|nr:F0F1 ATP synthase subunit B [Mycobacteriales bacterium]